MKRSKDEKIKAFTQLHSDRAGCYVPPLEVDDGREKVNVYVEGYEDVAFWRSIFDHFENPYLRFEISVPNREDLPKGKKVLMSMIPRSSEYMLLCVDSDFDYLFGESTEQAREVCNSEFMFHTYTYATENYLCYAPSLHNVCVKATKSDSHIFDFVEFMTAYSRTIYPLFLWYAYSAQLSHESVFPLIDFKNAVRIGYVELENNGADTIAWLERQVNRKLSRLEQQNPHMVAEMPSFAKYLRGKGVEPECTYLFMHGHTLMDNVVMILLNTVCDRLRQMSIAKINSSSKTGLPLKNELSNYFNTLRSTRDVLLDNENYTSCPLYAKLEDDIERYINRTIEKIKARREGVSVKE
ncbi:MAG: DUF4435 domain-containing protein [Alistipes sp.]|nr:DUF4435 domain-containing protein [Alistipes sp.]